jgi:alanine racemase
MNRLGLTIDQALDLADDQTRPASLMPVLVMSHLACADEAAHPMNRRQLESFQTVAAAFDGIDSSLCNSAGIALGPDFHFDLTRPGISLYGGRATSGAAVLLKPVARAEARILQIRDAKASETVSYGAAEVLKRDTRIAVCAVGYADGYHRSHSGAGVPLRTDDSLRDRPGSQPDGNCRFSDGSPWT